MPLEKPLNFRIIHEIVERYMTAGIDNLSDKEQIWKSIKGV